MDFSPIRGGNLRERRPQAKFRVNMQAKYQIDFTMPGNSL